MIIKYNLQFFAKDGPGGEKTEQPTSKKLQDARKEGQVAKSKEIANAFVLLSMFLLIRVYIGVLGEGLTTFFYRIYAQIPDAVVMYNGLVPVRAMTLLVGEMDSSPDCAGPSCGSGGRCGLRYCPGQMAPHH